MFQDCTDTPPSDTPAQSRQQLLIASGSWQLKSLLAFDDSSKNSQLSDSIVFAVCFWHVPFVVDCQHLLLLSAVGMSAPRAVLSPPSLSMKSLPEWPQRVAIVPWGKLTQFGEPAVLSDGSGGQVVLESPSELTVWASRQRRQAARVST